MKFYLVGGAVRDRLLGLEPQERDWVVVGATPGELDALGYRRLDAEFPVFAHPASGEEYALARRERKTDPGHKGFVVEFGPDVTLEEDLRRRDLRVNAIAESESGELIDPHGGLADIESRTLRHVSPAFVEDPLRVLRAARFSARFGALGFSIHPSTLELMRAMSREEEMGALSPSRVWRETEKALATEQPARYFSALAECGALAWLLPECCARNAGDPARAVWLDLVLDALRAASALDGRTEVRFAALAAALAATASDGDASRVLAAYPLPKRHTELARVASALRRDLASAPEPRPEALLAAMENADAFRRGERFNDVLVVLHALEASGAEGLEGKVEALDRGFAAARAENGAALSRAGLKGEEIATELGRRRLDAIAKSLTRSGKRGSGPTPAS